MTARSEKKAERREQILAAGLSLFVKKGLAATKVSDIADAVGMSIGLLFHYFPSKELLYEELIHAGIERSRSALSADDSDPLAFLTHTANTILTGNHFTVEMFVFMNQALANEQLSSEIREKMRHDNLAQTAKMIARGQKSGTIRSGDPLALAIAFWGAVQGVCQIIVQIPNAPRPGAEWLMDIIKLEEKPE